MGIAQGTPERNSLNTVGPYQDRMHVDGVWRSDFEQAQQAIDRAFGILVLVEETIDTRNIDDAHFSLRESLAGARQLLLTGSRAFGELEKVLIDLGHVLPDDIARERQQKRFAAERAAKAKVSR